MDELFIISFSFCSIGKVVIVCSELLFLGVVCIAGIDMGCVSRGWRLGAVFWSEWMFCIIGRLIGMIGIGVNCIMFLIGCWLLGLFFLSFVKIW